MNPQEHKWVSVFLEVALRAIRRVHFEYGIFGAGRQWKTGPGLPSLINMGPGIELADERAVCAALAQEFMVSQSLAGLWLSEAGTDVRFFAIAKEQLYGTSRKTMDLIIERYEQTERDGFRVIKPRSLLEAKRARLWQIDKQGRVRPGASQVRDVSEDVRKLLRGRAALKRDKEPRVYLHLLVWGVYGDGANRGLDHPTPFFEAVRRKARRRLSGPYVRWLPIEWNPPDDARGQPVVRKSVWVALAEVERPRGRRRGQRN